VSVASSGPGPDHGEPSLESARRALEQGQFDSAVQQAEALLGRGDADASTVRYLLAVACRYAGDCERAEAALQELLATEPRHARAWQERGYVALKRDDPNAAREYFRHAVTHNSALVASWRTLVRLYGAAGEPELAGQAARRVDELSALPREILAAASHLNEDRLYKAEQICRDYLRENPTHIPAMRLLAEIGVRLQVLDDAEFLLESALEFEPDNELARADYANVLIRRQKFAKALEALRPLLLQRTDHVPYRIAEAMATAGSGDHEAAIAQYRQILKNHPDLPQLHVSLGHAQKTIGDIKGAVASYQQAHGIRRDFGDAYWSLANTKTYRFTPDEIDGMRQAEAGPQCGTEDRIHLCFAAGKALEDAGRYQESFEYYERGNRLKQGEVSYDTGQTDRRVEAQMAVCSRELFARQEGHGDPAPDPIFVVGLPRAGSTLLEQILASHSMVDGTMELPSLLAIAQRLRGRSSVRSDRYPRILGELKPEQFQQLGAHYLQETMPYRQGAPRFVDKMPNNFFHVGLIRLLLPNAKVIDARRHPMACCFSGFKQLFGEGQEFSYGLTEIGHYYRRYVELMAHWDEVLPGFVLRVQHEAVVDDLEGQVRRILDFCGLPFETACVEFHRTERAIRTPSSEQVRQPIYRQGLDQWQHFEDWLDPLKAALGDTLG
jgi:tetratricopeptide (TPR) repeat protein